MANPYTLTIGASNKTHEIKAGSLRYTESLQNRGSINFSVVSADGSYKPSKWAAVTIQKDGVIVAKGVVTRPPYGGVSGHGTSAIETSTNCGDLKTHWEKRRLTVEIAEGTMKAALQDAALADIYTAQGFTLDQPDDGPTVGPFDFSNVTLFEAIRAIADACDPIRVIELDLDDLEFRLIEPGDTASPWDIDDSNQKQNVDGDLNIEPNGDLEANNVLVEFGGDRLLEVKDEFTGDGSTDEFTLRYAVAGPMNPASGYVGRAVVRNGLHWETIGPVGAGKIWEYDDSDLTNITITRTTGAPSNGNALWMTYEVQFPQTVRAFDAPSIADIGQVDFKVPAPNLYSKADAQKIADQTLAAMLGGPRIVRYTTTRSGLRVGQTQHIQSTIRDIDADCLITEISATDRGGSCLVYEITAVEGGLPPKPWQDAAKQAFGGGAGGSNTSPPSPGSTSGNTDGSGGGGIGGSECDCCNSLEFSLSDAEFKALPSTYKVLVPAPGPGKVLVLANAALFMESGGGAYGDVFAGQGIGIVYGESWLATASMQYSDPHPDKRLYLWTGGGEVKSVDDTPPNGYLVATYISSMSRLLVNQPLVLAGWNDGGDYSGGSALNSGLGRVCYWVLDVPDEQFVPSACTTEVWSDDFESGSALSSDYDGNLDVAKTASVGYGGSAGLAGTGTASEAFFGYVTKIVAKDNRRGCVTCKIKPDTGSIEASTEFQIIRVSSTTDTSFAPQFNIELNSGSGGVAAGAVGFNVRGDSNIFSNEISGVLAHGVWVEFRIEWEMSSVLTGVRQSDGWAKLFVNGVLAYEVTGILLNDPNPSWSSANPDNYWQLVQFCPLGLGDDLLIGKP